MAKNSPSSVGFHFPSPKSHFLIDDSGLIVSHTHLFYDLFLHKDALRKNSLKWSNYKRISQKNAVSDLLYQLLSY